VFSVQLAVSFEVEIEVEVEIEIERFLDSARNDSSNFPSRAQGWSFL